MTNSEISVFIQNQVNKLIDDNEDNDYIQYLPFYENIEDKNLKYLFSYFQYHLNHLFNFMNQKQNGHYNAEQSRQLISLIKDIRKVISIVKKFKIDDQYLKIIDECSTFLLHSGGSPIPDNFEQIEIIDFKPIFYSTTTINTNNESIHYQLKNIGSGSYAEVFKYKDTYYDKHFALKKAKKNLNPKELERFRIEFDSMKKLKSPYILEVYTFDEDQNHYIMEYADETLYDYIIQNNTKLNMLERKNIISQIFKSFEYIHNSIGLHRDISPTNILLKHYDNLVVIKVSDFGLVKIKDSNLTDDNTEFKGSLNDPKLNVIGGFKNYSIKYETYALTRLIYFIITGRKVIRDFKNKDFEDFIIRGVSDDLSERYSSIFEMKNLFYQIDFSI